MCRWPEYFVDIVMCIDVTASMAPVLDEIRKTILTFFDRFRLGIRENGAELGKGRIKVIAFRDYGYDSEPLQESPFYTIPGQKGELRRFLDSLEAYGGVENYSRGIEPACALEAMALAFQSEWTCRFPRRRHLIFVFTDAPAWRLWQRAEDPQYPYMYMPNDLDSLRNWWDGTAMPGRGSFDHIAGRMLIMAPETYPWTAFEDWDECGVAYCPIGSLTPSFVRETMDELFDTMFEV